MHTSFVQLGRLYVGTARKRDIGKQYAETESKQRYAQYLRLKEKNLKKKK